MRARVIGQLHREEVKLTQFQNWSLRDGEGEKIDRNITSIGFQW